MYCHYIGWCIGKCPLYGGIHYSECPLSEVPLYIHFIVYTCICTRHTVYVLTILYMYNMKGSRMPFL